jgi:hypothetical protein
MDKSFVWSYSFLSTYARCARQGQARYITKEMPYVETPQMAHGNAVHSAFEVAIEKEEKLPGALAEYERYVTPVITAKKSGANVVPELKLGVTHDWEPTGFFDSNVWGRGKLDAPIIHGSTAFLIDWKTGNTWEDPTELNVQAVLLHTLYPELTAIKGCYVWLKAGVYGTTYDLLAEVERTKDWIEGTMDKLGKGLFYATPNKLCGWCDLMSCAHNKKGKK